MPDDMRDYLAKKSAELGLERQDQLAEIQAMLDEIHPNQFRAVSIQDGTLKVTTRNASAASELRYAQLQLLKRFEYIKKLRIQAL